MAPFASQMNMHMLLENVHRHTAVFLLGLVHMCKVYAVQLWQHYAGNCPT